MLDRRAKRIVGPLDLSLDNFRTDPDNKNPYAFTGTTDAGENFDWFRQDQKPGLLNLNLIIDEEVFAGLFDDPRLNERVKAAVQAEVLHGAPLSMLDAADLAAGRINLLRVYQGTLAHDTQLANTRSHAKERIGQLIVFAGKGTAAK